MAVRSTQICCCGASTWTAVFGWIQLVLLVSAVIFSAMILSGLAKLKNDPRIEPHAIKVVSGVTWALLVISVVHADLGIMLIIGNKRENVKLLRIWLILTAMTHGISVIIANIVFATKGDSTYILPVCIHAGITAFMIFCVYKRIQDINVGQQSAASQGYNKV